MRHLKVFGIALLAVVFLASAAAVRAPAAHGQSRVRVQAQAAQAQAPTPDGHRRVEVLGGRGSEIGVTIRDVNEADVQRADLPRAAGVVVEEVRRDSPAARAGIEPGDIVIEFDGERVRSARQFSRLVQESPQGRPAGLAVLRDGRRVALDVTPDAGAGLAILGAMPQIDMAELGERLRGLRLNVPELREFHIPDIEITARVHPGRLGASVQDLGPQLAEYFGVRGGVLVTSVREGSPAARAGLQAGDVITGLEGESVRTSAELRRRLARVEEGREFTLSVVRDRQELTLEAALERPARTDRQAVVRRTV
jgi:serine protease Do